MSTAASAPVPESTTTVAQCSTATSHSETASPNAGFPAIPGRTDVILQSSDGFDFHFFRTGLSLASIFFANFFDVPKKTSRTDPSTTSSSTKGDIEVIPLPETGRTVALILSAINLRIAPPLATSTPQNLEEWAALPLAAEKYIMEGIPAYAEEKLVALLDATGTTKSHNVAGRNDSSSTGAIVCISRAEGTPLNGGR